MNNHAINVRYDVICFLSINQVDMQPLYNNDDNTGVEENTIPSPTITNQQQQIQIPSATTLINQTSNSLVAQFFDRFPDPVSSFAPQIEPKLLPIHYQPSEYDVTSGRGRGNYNQNGNKQFRCIVLQYVDEYMSQRAKSDKTHVLEKIVTQVQKQNSNTTKFVQYNSKNKRWYELSHDQAREKVGHVIRAMTQQSSSSTTKAATTTTTATNTINTTLKKDPMEIVSDTMVSPHVASVPSDVVTTATVGKTQATLLQQQTSMFQNMLKRSCDRDNEEDDVKVDQSSIEQNDSKRFRRNDS